MPAAVSRTATATFAGAGRTLGVVRRGGEPYTFGFDPWTSRDTWRHGASP